MIKDDDKSDILSGCKRVRNSAIDWINIFGNIQMLLLKKLLFTEN